MHKHKQMVQAKSFHALTYATLAHDRVNQRRKFSNEPYIVHPMHVGALLREAGEPDDVIAAGYLHDVIEDTADDPAAAEQEIRSMFGDRIANFVMEVTDVSKPSDGNRAIRKAMDREHLANASHGGQSIKLADLISNSLDILERDRNFAMVYIPEKIALLEVLVRGNSLLYQMANDIAEKAMRELYPAGRRMRM